ncbi:MAG: pilus assembly protein PilM [Planctomycetaceae bacterium]|nr:pilus assembly protein PilM [Planctomycetaceae bacterium]
MLFLSSLLAPFSARQFAARSNWIGIDIGRSALKLAEVEQQDGIWKINQIQFAPICESGLWQQKHLSASVLSSEVSQLVSLSTGWKNRQAAALISLSAADYRVMNLPDSSREEYEEMIHQELITEYQEDVIFDFWEPDAELSDTSDDIKSLMVYSIAKSNANAVGQALERAKIHCRVLDGLPFCLARALTMMDPGILHKTTVALDWGYSTVTLLFLKQGKPFYSRTLKGCQFQVFLKRLAQELDVSERQCWNLLQSSLANESRSTEFLSALNKRLNPVIEDYLLLVQKEMNRTIQYVRTNTHLSEWDRIWVFGGGALFRQLYEPLSVQLQIPMRPWELRLSKKLDTPLHRDLVPLFGPAAALASLRRWH